MWGDAMKVKNIVGVVIDRMSPELDRVFHYTAPDEMYEMLEIGMVVRVPFGRGGAVIDGYVVDMPEETEVKNLKEILAIVSPEPLFDTKMLAVCRMMQKECFCTLASAIRAITPPGSGARRERTNDKTITGSSLAIGFDEAFSILETVRKKAPAQAKIIELLLQNDFVANADIRFLTGASQSAIKSLEQKGIILPQEMEVFRNPVEYDKIERTKPLAPTPEQKQAIDRISEAAEKGENRIFLLHGVTGSGKTEVFLQAIESVIKRGKSAIVLVPEISLTPQTVARFVGRFGERVAILHSRLSLGERHDEYKRIKRGQADVVVGVRSAVFAPLSNLGLIVMDEEHETSYKAENVPAYHARDIAKKRAEQYGIPLVLASATPSLESYFHAKNGEYELFTLPERANESKMPEAEIVDMRKELVGGNRSVLSARLKEEIAHNLERKEQTILFLNRRGFSTFVSCRNCGYVVRCEHCNIPMTYHKNKNFMTCHYCGYTTPNPAVCPECGSPYIRHFGAGTQKVEEEVKELFPNATVLRMDVDTTGGKASHQKILEQFEKEKIDILIGTQMVAKGLDFPNVTLVGVLAADLTLNLDDFRAGERTFDLVTQVCGRAGRGEKKGRALIQTYQPESHVLHYAKQQDFGAFYEEEIELRRALSYPPFCDIFSVLLTGNNEQALSAYAAKIANQLRMETLKNDGMNVEVLGPGPAVLGKINNKYRYRILLKCEANDEVRNMLYAMQKKHHQAKESKWISLLIEANPNSML